MVCVKSNSTCNLACFGSCDYAFCGKQPFGFSLSCKIWVVHCCGNSCYSLMDWHFLRNKQSTRQWSYVWVSTSCNELYFFLTFWMNVLLPSSWQLSGWCGRKKCVGCVGRFVAIWPVTAERGKGGVWPVLSQWELRILQMRNNIWQARTMFLQNVGTWARHPKRYCHLNKKHCGKLTTYGQSHVVPSNFVTLTAMYLLKKVRVLFPDNQDFHCDHVPYPQGTSCKVIFGPRNKTVGVSLYMANFVLCVFQVPVKLTVS